VTRRHCGGDPTQGAAQPCRQQARHRFGDAEGSGRRVRQLAQPKRLEPTVNETAIRRSSSSVRGLRIACPLEIALRLGYISVEAFHELAQRCAKSSYGEYLLSVYCAVSTPAAPAR
jgi:dTDP-glucose pyrophosphorylase